MRAGTIFRKSNIDLWEFWNVLQCARLRTEVDKNSRNSKFVPQHVEKKSTISVNALFPLTPLFSIVLMKNNWSGKKKTFIDVQLIAHLYNTAITELVVD